MKAEVAVKEEDLVEVAKEEEDLVEEGTIRATMEAARTRQLK